MSIIEETLRQLQTKQTGSDKPAVDEENISNNGKKRTRPFVMIMIVLIVLGLGAYMAIGRYQEWLNEKNMNFSYETGYPETETLPVIENQEVPVIIEESKQQSIDTQADAAEQPSPVVSVQPSPLPVSANQISDPLEKGVQGKDIRDRKKAGIVELKQKTIIVPVDSVDSIGSVEPKSKQIVLEDERQKFDSKTEGADAAVLNQSSATSSASEPEHKQSIDEKKTIIASVNQQTDTTLPSEPSVDSLLLEEYAIKKQISRAKNLIMTGSYTEAIDMLKTIIGRSEGTWDTYLLIGTAYLGSGELDNAEAYLDMGLAINANIPQLWLQRAIVEQQRGNHEIALQILHETESIAPDMPEVQLNIGYSYDIIGNKNLSAKAYLSFLRLTEGNRAYMMVRHKILKRLQHLK